MVPAGFPGDSVKNPPARHEMQVQSLDLKDPPEEEMVTHSSIVAWKKFHGQRSLEGHGVTKESDTAEWLSRAPGAYTVSYVWSWKGSEAVLLIEYIKNSSIKQTHFCWVGHSKTRSKSMPIQSCFPIFIRLLVAFKVESKELWRSYKYVIVFWILNWSQYGKASEQHWVQSDDSTAFVSVIITSTFS